MVRAVDRKEAPEYEGMDEEDEQIKQQAAQLEEDVDDVSSCSCCWRLFHIWVIPHLRLAVLLIQGLLFIQIFIF